MWKEKQYFSVKWFYFLEENNQSIYNQNGLTFWFVSEWKNIGELEIGMFGWLIDWKETIRLVKIEKLFPMKCFPLLFFLLPMKSKHIQLFSHFVSQQKENEQMMHSEKFQFFGRCFIIESTCRTVYRLIILFELDQSLNGRI